MTAAFFARARIARCTTVLLLSASLLGCDDGPGVFPSDGGKNPPIAGGSTEDRLVVDPPSSDAEEGPDVPSLPLSNGTLGVSPDGAWAVAADTDGDALYVISLHHESQRRVDLEPGTAPGRVVVGPHHAYFLSRRDGELREIELVNAEPARQLYVCPAPQGVALGGPSQPWGQLHVACRDGDLVSIETIGLSETRRVFVADDLRDVVLRGNELVVSRFRSAEILLLDADAAPVRRLYPARLTGSQPRVAWRLLALPSGRLALAHQMHKLSGIDVARGGSYGETSGSACGEAIASLTISIIDPDVPITTSDPDDPYAPYTIKNFPLVHAAGVVDFAMAEDWITVAVPGNALAFAPLDPAGAHAHALIDIQTSALPTRSCNAGTRRDEPAIPVGVAYDATTGRTLIQTRSPGLLRIGGSTTIHLHDEQRQNRGLRLFQMNSGGIACASCHPEGREDAHTWSLGRGPRRTQSLEGGLGQAPFHWDGEFMDLPSLLEDVLGRRMSFEKEITPTDVASLKRFLDAIPKATASVASDAVSRGQELFGSEELACASCHEGPLFTDRKLWDVGTGGEFVTPSLLGLRTRAPYLHDGCAPHLEARFVGPCGGGDRHGTTSQLSPQEVDDLIAFLGSL